MLKKILRRMSQGLAVVVVLVAALALYVQVDGIPRYPHETPALTIEQTPERVERGKKLASLLCNECHADNETHRLTGRLMGDIPKEFGVVYSANITQARIGKWTDGELVYFLRTGVRPDGQYVPPWMVKLPHLSDEDVGSIVAYLRSDDPAVAPSDVQPPGITKPSFLAKALSHGVFGPLPYPKAPISAPPRTDRVAYGRYLVYGLDCYSCHSADFKTVNVLEPEKTPGFMGGGNPLVGADEKPIHSANLTPDEATGIGAWTEDDFVRAVRTGVRPDGRVLRAPMLPRPTLDEDEVRVMCSYLRTVPRLRNAVPRPAAPEALSSTGHLAGKRLYQGYGCASCHGENGAGPIADLRGANEHYPTEDGLRGWLEDAPSKKPGARMPPMKGVIRDDDYAPLMAYVRTLARSGKHAAG